MTPGAVAARRRTLTGRSAAALLILCAVAMAAPPPGADPTDKLSFDPDALDANGLIGPASGKRALDYAFCIPTGPGFAAEVRAIDASARLRPRSRGRIGCTDEQVLVLGNTHQPDFAAVLRRLAALPYIQRIAEAWFE